MAKGQYLAYAFTSNLPLKEMLQRLNVVSPWKWSMGDSDEYGEYLVTRPYRGFSKFRIFDEEGRFVFDVFYSFEDHGAEDLWDSQHSLILNEVLPSLGARDVRPTDNYG